MGGFYFLTDQYRAHSQPTPDHKNSQDPRRTKIMSCLFFLVWRANHAGAQIIISKRYMQIAYFATNKISPNSIMFV